MDSRKRFSALETMCRKRAQLAKREFEYWLAEADEWARYKESSDPSIEVPEWVSKQRIIRELFLTQSGARIFELENEHHWPI